MPTINYSSDKITASLKKHDEDDASLQFIGPKVTNSLLHSQLEQFNMHEKHSITNVANFFEKPSKQPDKSRTLQRNIF